jgi:ribose transport system substrate-binding protein
VLAFTVFAEGKQEKEKPEDTTMGVGADIMEEEPSRDIERTGFEPPPTEKSTPIKVGFCPTAMNTHYDIVIAGAKTAVDELGGEDVIDLVIQAPSSQSGISEQMDILENWVNMGYDAITVCTANDKALNPIYREAADKGIPVFHFNTPIAASVNKYFVSNVGYSQFQAGKAIGEWLVENFGDKPTNLVIIEGLPGVHNTMRLSGFMSAVEGNENINLLASQPGDWVRNKAQSVMENILTKYGDEIDVVWGMYDEMALGALAAIKSQGLAGEITVMGYDNTPDAYRAIKEGEMHVTVDTAPKEMGYKLIKAVKKYVVDGEVVSKVIDCDVQVYDQSNIDDFDTAHYEYVPE